MKLPDARSLVAMMLGGTICIVILAPVIGRVVERLSGYEAPALSDTAISGLVETLKYVSGGLMTWLTMGRSSPQVNNTEGGKGV